MLVCDVLYGKGLRCGGPLKSAIRRHTEEMKIALKAMRHSLDPSSPSGIFLYIAAVQYSETSDKYKDLY